MNALRLRLSLRTLFAALTLCGIGFALIARPWIEYRGQVRRFESVLAQADKEKLRVAVLESPDGHKVMSFMSDGADVSVSNALASQIAEAHLIDMLILAVEPIGDRTRLTLQERFATLPDEEEDAYWVRKGREANVPKVNGNGGLGPFPQ